MKIDNITRDELEAALSAANEQFDGNLVFKSIEPKNATHTRWLVTLTVVSSKGQGARRSHSGRRISAACWHAYGTFFDALPTTATYYAPSVVGYDNWGRERLSVTAHKPGDPWEDWNIGSIMRPMYYSEACDCD